MSLLTGSRKGLFAKASGIFHLFLNFIVFLLSVLLFQISVFGNASLDDSIQAKTQYTQWFTGPVLTPTPITMEPGHPALELAFLFLDTYGSYNSKWKLERSVSLFSTGPYIDFQIGFNKILGAEFIGSIITNLCQGSSSTHPQDSIFRIGFQILNDQKGSWTPDFRILLQETVPTGKYQKLDAKKHGTDSTGQGSFQTGMHLVFQKLFHPQKNHDFRVRWSLGYFIPCPVHVRGINYYGGSTSTRGIVYPGKHFTGFLCGEYALSRKWALACELNYQQGAAGRFKRKRGTKIKILSFNQLSVLPEIQHTFTANLGMIIGGWLTATGKNSPAFGGAFASVLYTF